MLQCFVRKKPFARLFFILVCLSHVSGSLYALSEYAQQTVVVRQKKRQRRPIVEYIFMAHDEEQNEQGDECVQEKEPLFLGNTEMKELELPIVHYLTDYSATSFGHWQLEHFMRNATADIETITHRQDVVKALLDDPEFLACARKALPFVAQSEGALIAYWNENDALTFRAEDLFYDFPWVENVNAYLNDSKTALDINAAFKMIRRFDALFIEMCKVSIAKELLKLSIGVTNKISIEEILFGNLKSMLNAHKPWYVLYDANTYAGTQAQYSDIMENGSFADRWAVFLRGSSYDDGHVSVLKEDGWLKKGWDNTFGAVWGATFGKVFPHFSLQYEWKKEQMQDISDASLGKKALVGLGVAGYTAYLDYALYTGTRDSFKARNRLLCVFDSLRARLVDVMKALHSIAVLEKHVAQHPVISGYDFAQKMKLIRAENVSHKLKALIEILKENTFKGRANLDYSKWGLWLKHQLLLDYSHGRVLLAHKLLLEIKHELAPILQGVAEFDAYVSIATLMQEHADNNAQFNFVEFIEHDTPVLKSADCWVPIISPDNAILNDVVFGCDNQPNKWVITGPNGGGKSTYLKALGHTIALAHSYGVVPAKHAQMTPFYGLRTCLRPEESLLDDMSQFMAEKKRMDEMLSFVQKSDTDHKIAVLIDEPFRGTVDAESAERIYDFGNQVVQKPDSIVCIATHVEKPVRLAHDTNGAFGNCHVAIAEHRNGSFKRLFKVQPGCESWWFDDAAKRSRFIDWLSTQYAIDQLAES